MGKLAETTKRLNITMDAELIEKATEVANEKERNLSQLIVWLYENYLASKKSEWD